jgi:hypothetical protein
MRKRFTITAAALLLTALGASGCSSLGLGPQPEAPAAPEGDKNRLYTVDMTKPEGPMYQILRAAQERDEKMFKEALAPDINASLMDEVAFRKFRKKVLSNKTTPVPESVQQVSDTEAIVKMRNSRGREIPVRVKKYGDKWLVTGIDVGNKVRQRFEERHPETAPAAPAVPPAAPGA